MAAAAGEPLTKCVKSRGDGETVATATDTVRRWTNEAFGVIWLRVETAALLSDVLFEIPTRNEIASTEQPLENLRFRVS